MILYLIYRIQLLRLTLCAFAVVHVHANARARFYAYVMSRNLIMFKSNGAV